MVMLMLRIKLKTGCGMIIGFSEDDMHKNKGTNLPH
jgi:hypothetical protein